VVQLTFEEWLQKAIADATAEYQAGNLALNRDIFSNISLPTSYGGLTGFLPSGYPGYGGLPTFGSLTDTLGAFGYTGNDPRWAQMGYGASEQTLLFRNLVLNAQQIQGGWQQQASNRALQQAEVDARMSLDTGQPYIGGQPAPAWLRPYAGWAREFMQRNGGLVPNGPDFNAALQRGEVHTDDGGRVNPGGTVSYYSPDRGWVEGGRVDQSTGRVVRTAQGQPGQWQMFEGGPQMGGQEPFYGASGAGATTRGLFGQGDPRSQAQRNLEEQGRQYDLGFGQRQREFDTETALRALQQESQLSADPFQQAQYRYGLGQAGIPNVINAVAGRGVLPGVQGGYGPAPDRPTLANQVARVGGQPTFGQPGGPAGLEQQAGALGPLSQINARNYLRAGPLGQQYVNSAYRWAGQAQNDQDVQDMVQRQLPQFARRGVPTFGRMM